MSWGERNDLQGSLAAKGCQSGGEFGNSGHCSCEVFMSTSLGERLIWSVNQSNLHIHSETLVLRGSSINLTTCSVSEYFRIITRCYSCSDFSIKWRRSLLPQGGAVSVFAGFFPRRISCNLRSLLRQITLSCQKLMQFFIWSLRMSSVSSNYCSLVYCSYNCSYCY